MNIEIQQKLNIALECQNTGKFQEAQNIYNEILQEQPFNDEALFNLGSLYFIIHQFDSAIYCFLKFLEFNPDNLQVLNNIGITYHQRGDLSEALKYFEKAININPNLANTHRNIGNLYKDANLFDNAIYFHKSALLLEPQNPEFYYYLGLDYKHIEEYDEALKNFFTAIQLGLINSEIYYNIANIYELISNVDEGIKYYKKAIELDNTNTQAYLRLSQLYLVSENFDKGWKYHEFRIIDKSQYIKSINSLGEAVWEKQSLKNKNIFVYHEVGLGDTIHFVRYLKLLNKLGAHVYFKSQSQLIKLLEESNIGAEIVDNDNALAMFNGEFHVDAALPLLSLPYFFGTNLNNIPYPEGYLKANQEKVSFYHKKYFQNNDFKIGISWQGNKSMWRDKDRSVSLDYFYSIAKLFGIMLYSLQKNDEIDQLIDVQNDIEIINIGETFENFSDIAAAIENLDLVITVDTSIAHLAGALSKPTWLLLSTYPDWRWFINKDYSPWYSSLKIIRQRERGNWNDVFQEAETELKKKLSKV